MEYQFLTMPAPVHVNRQQNLECTANTETATKYQYKCDDILSPTIKSLLFSWPWSSLLLFSIRLTFGNIKGLLTPLWYYSTISKSDIFEFFDLIINSV